SLHHCFLLCLIRSISSFTKHQHTRFTNTAVTGKFTKPKAMPKRSSIHGPMALPGNSRIPDSSSTPNLRFGFPIGASSKPATCTATHPPQTPLLSIAPPPPSFALFAPAPPSLSRVLAFPRRPSGTLPRPRHRDPPPASPQPFPGSQIGGTPRLLAIPSY